MLKNITVMNHINVPAIPVHNDIMDRFFDMGIFKPFDKRSKIKTCYNQE